MNMVDEQIRAALHGDGPQGRGGYAPSVGAIKARRDAYRRRRQTRTGFVAVAGLLAVVGLALTLAPGSDDAGQGLQTQPDVPDGSTAPPPPDAGGPATLAAPQQVVAVETFSDLGDPVRQRLVLLDVGSEDRTTLYEPAEFRVIGSLSTDGVFVYFVEGLQANDPEEGCVFQESRVMRIPVTGGTPEAVAAGVAVAVSGDGSVAAIVDFCERRLNVFENPTVVLDPASPVSYSPARVVLDGEMIGDLQFSPDGSTLLYSVMSRSTPATYAVDLADLPDALAERQPTAFGESRNLALAGPHRIGITYITTAAGPQASQRLRFDSLEGTPFGEPVEELVEILDGAPSGHVLEQRIAFGTEIDAGELWLYPADRPEAAVRIPHGGFSDAIFLEPR